MVGQFVKGQSIGRSLVVRGLSEINGFVIRQISILYIIDKADKEEQLINLYTFRNKLRT